MFGLTFRDIVFLAGGIIPPRDPAIVHITNLDYSGGFDMDSSILVFSAASGNLLANLPVTNPIPYNEGVDVEIPISINEPVYLLLDITTWRTQPKPSGIFDVSSAITISPVITELDGVSGGGPGILDWGTMTPHSTVAQLSIFNPSMAELTSDLNILLVNYYNNEVIFTIDASNVPGYYYNSDYRSFTLPSAADGILVYAIVEDALSPGSYYPVCSPPFIVDSISGQGFDMIFDSDRNLGVPTLPHVYGPNYWSVYWQPVPIN